MNGAGGRRHRPRAWRVGLATLAALALALATFALASPPAAQAATTIPITTCDYAALASAISSAASGDTLQFGCDGVISFDAAHGGGGTISLYKTLTISGAGHSVTLDGGGSVQIFQAQGSNLTLDGLTVAHGNSGKSGAVYNNGGALTITNSTFSGNAASIGGGGVFSYGTLAITDSTFSGNSASGFGGGGVYNAGGTVTITNSTFAGNAADPGAGLGTGGGGVYNQGTLTITNSTLSGNAADYGGAVYNTGGSLTITNSTINGNSASGLGEPFGESAGGGVWNAGGLTIKNSIVVNNTGPWSGWDDCGGTGGFIDGGYNLTNASTNYWMNICAFGASTDVRTDDPKLGGLADNGGPTPTVALLAGSPAIDQIPVGANGCGTTITTDQRGITRPQGAMCDIGAFEVVQDTTPPAITITMPQGLSAPDDPTNTTSYYAYQQRYAASYSCSDSESGVAECNGSTTETSGQVGLDTSSVGKKTFTVTATDKAGNMAEKTQTYFVIYESSGVLPPIRADGSSIFKLGSTIPVKVQLTGAGAGVTDAVVRLYAVKIDNQIEGTVLEPVSTSAADTGNTFRYDPTSQQYIFNLSTKGNAFAGQTFSVGTWRLKLYVGGDNTTGALLTQVDISLK